METVLNWAVALTLLGWVATEAIMQVRQYRMGERAKTTEWGSLGVVGIALGVGYVLAIVAKHALPDWRLPVSAGVAFAIALPIAWAGIALRLWAIHTLGRFFRGVVHVQEGHEVVRDGPYRLVRHPAYAGAMVAVAGLSLTYLNYASAVVFFASILFGVVHRIRIEERVLLAGLGEPYRDYATHTARLVPGVW